MTILTEILSSALAFVVAVVFYAPIILLHEFGHWIVFRLYGYKAEFKINLFGDFEMGRNIHNKVNLIESTVSIFVGISAGLLPFILYRLFFAKILLIAFIVIYCLSIQQDVMTLQMMISFKGKSWKKTTLFDVNEYHYKKYVESVNKGDNY